MEHRGHISTWFSPFFSTAERRSLGFSQDPGFREYCRQKLCMHQQSGILYVGLLKFHRVTVRVTRALDALSGGWRQIRSAGDRELIEKARSASCLRTSFGMHRQDQCLTGAGSSQESLRIIESQGCVLGTYPSIFCEQEQEDGRKNKPSQQCLSIRNS